VASILGARLERQFPSKQAIKEPVLGEFEFTLSVAPGSFGEAFCATAVALASAPIVIAASRNLPSVASWVGKFFRNSNNLVEVPKFELRFAQCCRSLLASQPRSVRRRSAKSAHGVLDEMRFSQVGPTALVNAPTSQRTSKTTSTRPSTPPNPGAPYRPWA
jgi:hypothetical protein